MRYLLTAGLDVLEFNVKSSQRRMMRSYKLRGRNFRKNSNFRAFFCDPWLFYFMQHNPFWIFCQISISVSYFLERARLKIFSKYSNNYLTRVRTHFGTGLLNPYYRAVNGLIGTDFRWEKKVEWNFFYPHPISFLLASLKAFGYVRW